VDYQAVAGQMTDDCMDARGRATPGAVAETNAVLMEAVDGNTDAAGLNYRVRIIRAGIRPDRRR